LAQYVVLTHQTGCVQVHTSRNHPRQIQPSNCQCNSSYGKLKLINLITIKKNNPLTETATEMYKELKTETVR
jgi:hypothetical protein